MSNDLIRRDGDRLFVTSLDISNHFAKRHYNVLRDIDALECTPEFRALNFELSSYITQQGKAQPMVEMTRDGFVRLCMSFTGHQAAVWKERYIAAFNAMEAELLAREAAAPVLVAPPAGLEESMARLAGEMAKLGGHMGELAHAARVQMVQLDVTARYINALEHNQQGRVRVTPQLREDILQLVAEGMAYADIARLVRVSRTTVSLIANGKYPMTGITNQPPDTVGQKLQAWVDKERGHAAAALEKLEARHD